MGVGNLHLFLQTGNNFQGRVLIDDIECYESYDFIPEVDVRKKYPLVIMEFFRFNKLL